jgi:hypothetical protein
MRQTLILLPDASGLPRAGVPFSSMCDLVEYLSCQQVAVMYHYYPSHFTVTFLRMDMESAQNILNEWVHEGVLELQPA